MQARKLLLPLLLGAASAAPVYAHRDLDSDEKTLVAKGQSFGKAMHPLSTTLHSSTTRFDNEVPESEADQVDETETSQEVGETEADEDDYKALDVSEEGWKEMKKAAARKLREKKEALKRKAREAKEKATRIAKKAAEIAKAKLAAAKDKLNYMGPPMTPELMAKAKTLSKLAWASYYPSEKWYADGEKMKDWDPPIYQCYDKSFGVSKKYFVPAHHLGNRSECGDQLDKWAFQGRVQSTVVSDKFGDARADVYFKGNQCLVSITGTKDTAGYFFDAFAGVASPFKKVNGRHVAAGFRLYYLGIRKKLQEACAGKTTVYTGHSLGAAAVLVAHAYGDTSDSITFATPKVFAGRCKDPFENAYAFYAVDETNTPDPVAAVGPVVSVKFPNPSHCATAVYSITKSSAGKFTIATERDRSPAMAPSLVRFFYKFKKVHPMVKTYNEYMNQPIDSYGI